MTLHREETNRPFPAYTVDACAITLGNPGLAAVAAILKSQYGTFIASTSKFLGRATPLQADYEALIHGIELAHERDAGSVEIRTSSQAMASQLDGTSTARDPSVMDLLVRALDLMARHEDIAVKVVSPDELLKAEELAHIAIRHSGTPQGQLG